MNRSSANSRSPGKCNSGPLEVPIPLVRPRMEESNKLARIRICSSYVRTFVAIAVQAGEGEILKDSEPSMLACNDVIDVKGQRIDGSRKVAILTSVLGTTPHVPDNIPVHELWRLRGFLLRASRAFDCMTASKFPIWR
jgi:hypothetical protein